MWRTATVLQRPSRVRAVAAYGTYRGRECGVKVVAEDLPLGVMQRTKSKNRSDQVIREYPAANGGG